MKNILIYTFLVCLIACKQESKEKENINTEDKKETVSKKNIEEVFYKANGNEPAWGLLIKKKGNDLNYELKLDYDSIRLTGKAELIKIKNSKTIQLLLHKKENKLPLKIELVNEKCNDVAGNVHNTSLDFHFDVKKRYLGCGDFVNNNYLEICKEPITKTNTNDSYVCFTENQNKKLKIWVSYTEGGRALKVKYKGQDKAIDLHYIKTEYNDRTITSYYNEFYEGKINGNYTITHVGNWDYVTYTRGKDNKKFEFTIDHEKNPWGSKPCF